MCSACRRTHPHKFAHVLLWVPTCCMRFKCTTCTHPYPYTLERCTEKASSLANNNRNPSQRVVVPSVVRRQKFKFPPPPTIIRVPTRETIGRPDWWVGIRDASRFYALGRRVLPRDFQPVGGCKSRWHCETMMRWVRA